MGKRRIVTSSVMALCLAGCGAYKSTAPTTTGGTGGTSTKSGTLDTTFGTSGVLTTSFGGTLFKVLARADASVVAAGVENSSGVVSFSLLHYTTAGIADTSFGSGSTGKVATALQSAKEVLLQSVTGGQAILIAGSTVSVASSGVSTTTHFLYRYTSAGVLDTSFNGTGSTALATPWTGGSFSVQAMAIQPTNGDILVAGEFTPTGGAKEFALARYSASGVLDTTFGSSTPSANGITTTNIATTPASTMAVTSLASDSSGRIFLSGTSCSGGAGYDPMCALVILRYTESGILDTTFGVFPSVGTAPGYAILPAKTSTGMLLTAAGNQPLLNLAFGGVHALARLLIGTSSSTLTPGGLDSTFGSAGEVSVKGTHMAEAADGTLLVSGTSVAQNMTVTRYTALGAADTTFNASGTIPGTLEISVPSQLSYSSSVAVDSNKYILVGGNGATFTAAGPAPTIAIARVVP